jgi:hypothetical protein
MEHGRLCHGRLEDHVTSWDTLEQLARPVWRQLRQRVLACRVALEVERHRLGCHEWRHPKQELTTQPHGADDTVGRRGEEGICKGAVNDEILERRHQLDSLADLQVVLHLHASCSPGAPSLTC